MLKEDYLQVSKELSSLKDKRNELEKELKLPHPREYIIECKYDLIKVNEKIQDLNDKLHILEKKIRIEEEKRLEEERKQKQKELHYKELYIELTESMPIFDKVFKITEWSNEESVRYLLDNYTEQQLKKILRLYDFLDSFVFDEFIHDFHTVHTPINILLNNYEIKCQSIDNLRPLIKNKIKRVESKWGLKFNEISTGQVEFIKDFSFEVNLESYILNNFPEYVMYLEDHVEDWDELSEYDKLSLISIDNFLDSYLSDLEDEISEIVEEDFDYYVDAKLPSKRNHISMQTPEYKVRKDGAYKKKIQRYDELISKKRNENKEKSDTPKCFKELNENSSIEEIANCFCECKDFNSWEFDKSNKKIIFKFLRADGKNYTKMKKIEVKKLKKWINNYKLT